MACCIVQFKHLVCCVNGCTSSWFMNFNSSVAFAFTVRFALDTFWTDECCQVIIIFLHFFSFNPTSAETCNNKNITIHNIQYVVMWLFYTTPIWSLWERWWKTNETAVSHEAFNTWSVRPFLSKLWFHCEKSLVQSELSAGGRTSLPFTQRWQRNLTPPRKEGRAGTLMRI